MLLALAQAVQALPAKLTEAQAQQTLAPILLPAKLTDAQAQQALAPMLKQISERAIPGALEHLGQAIQTLAAKLTEAQKQQALAAVLQQIGETTNPEVLQALAQANQAPTSHKMTSTTLTETPIDFHGHQISAVPSRPCVCSSR